jgi:hypothetical protein
VAGAEKALKDGNMVCFCDYYIVNIVADADAKNLLFGSDGLCNTYVGEKVGMITLEAMLSFMIIVLNIVTFRVVINTNGFQKFTSIVDREISVLQRIFIITFINSAVVTLAVNTDWSEFLGRNVNYNVNVNGKSVSIVRSGTYDDFAPTWYINVGLNIFITAVMNIFGPHIYPVSRLIYTILRRRWSDPISQQEMNELYLGEDFALSVSLSFSLSVDHYNS